MSWKQPWTNHKQLMNNSHKSHEQDTAHEQVMAISWNFFEHVMGKSWTHKQVMNKSWASQDEVMTKSSTSHEQINNHEQL